MANNETPRRRPRKQQKGWQRVLFHWRLPMIIVLVLMVLSGVLVHTVSSKIHANEKAKQSEQDKIKAEMITYEEAVVDALQAEQDEIHDLVCLVKEDGRVTYDEENDRVQLVFWTDQAAEEFKKDDQLTLEEYTWAYADLELASWGAANKDVLKNSKDARIRQMLGLPENAKGSTFVLVSVTPERVLRAAYQPDAQLKKMSLAFEETVDQDFISWFNGQVTANYFENPHPWTRLGYTYDWGKTGDDHYGVTEFVIPAGTKVTVKDTFTNDEMITRLRKGKLQ
ncbi:MAG: hypothetical protein KH050_05435 [Clostridiaceae bacterium]|nr:hypothetical protein [Clostridiaceae bacterium]